MKEAEDMATGHIAYEESGRVVTVGLVPWRSPGAKVESGVPASPMWEAGG